MRCASLLVLAGVYGAPASPIEAARPVFKDRKIDYRLTTPERFTECNTADLVESNHHLRLRASSGEARSSTALRDALFADPRGTVALQPTAHGASFAVDIGFGNQSFEVIFDSGSSDLWIAHSTVDCVDFLLRKIKQSRCLFGPLYHGDFEEGNVANENFNISYGDGEFLTGHLGYQDVTLAGIRVEKQQAALVDEAYWHGDNYTSGLMGFAYPSLTSAYPGDNPRKDNPNITDQYNPWITNAIAQGLIDKPLFSVAMERGPNGGSGYLSLGGLPPVTFKKQWTSTPIRILQLGRLERMATEFTYYTIVPDGFVVKAAGLEDFRGLDMPGYAGDNPYADEEFPAIVDTGTTLMYLPYNLTEFINGLYDPPAIYVPMSGVYETLCSATPPQVGVTINGTDFMISAEDLLPQGELGYDEATGLCVTGVQASPGPYILGEVFLKNVVTVFDIGASMMRFAPHMTY